MANTAAPMSMALHRQALPTGIEVLPRWTFCPKCVLQLTATRMRLDIHRDGRSPRFSGKYWPCSTLLWANLTSVESILELTQWKTTVQDLMFVIDNYVYLGLGNIAALDTTRILEISLLLAQMFIGVCRQLTRLTHVRPIGMVVRQPLLQSIVPRWASGSLWIELPWISQIARHWSIGY